MRRLPLASPLRLLALAAALAPAAAQAVGQPLGPAPREVFEGTLNYTATAGSLLDCGAGSCEFNSNGQCRGLDAGVSTLDDVPDLPNLQVRYAQLTWVASLPANQAPDMAVTLTPPAGLPIQVAADPARSEIFNDSATPADCQIPELLCGTPSANCDFTFASMHADVTAQLNAHLAGGGTLNGPWGIGGVDVPGSDDADAATAIEAIGSLTLGGWALLVVYEQPTLPLRRLYYYQGFEMLAGETRDLFPSDFLAPADPAADVTIFALEGDEGTQGDSLSVNDHPVQDACNPRNNVFNDTVHSGHADGRCDTGTRGVDLDTFHLPDAVNAGDTEAHVEIVVPAGGVLTGGEQIFTDWLMIAFNHRPPNFASLKPEKTATPPSHSIVQQGDAIEYAIQVENSGGDFATGVVVHDAPPAGTTYVPGSTIVDQSPVADDPGGVTALEAGLDLGRFLGHEHIDPGERHLLRFRVTVDADVPEGAVLTNVASISADGIDDVRTDPVQHPVGVLPDGGFPPPPDASPPPPDLDAARPTADGAPLTPFPDAAPPAPNPEAGICAPGEILGADGRCASADAAVPERDACVFGQASGPCAAGTVYDGTQCVALCGPGTHWDQICDDGCGRCMPDGQACEQKTARKSSGCGIAAPVSLPGAGALAGLSVLALALRGRRRRR